MKRAWEVGVPITWVEVEMSPAFCDFDLLNFCHQHSIGVLAWAPLNRGGLSNDKFLASVGKKYGKTAAQISLRWIIQNGCIPLPASQNKAHIVQNMAVLDFALTEQEMQELNQRAKAGHRTRVSFDEFDFSYEQCWPKS